WQVANDRDLTVALDITLTSDLINEGTARELINRIQNMRKTEGFDVTDRILVNIEKREEVVKAIEDYKTYIANEILADDILLSEEKVGTEVELFEGNSIFINIQKS